jgi:hypothetical protein
MEGPCHAALVTDSSGQHSPVDPLRDVDSAAIILAGLAGAAALFTGDGSWDAVAFVLGLVLVIVVTAFHRPVADTITLRTVLLRLAFGAVFALGLALVLAWPVQEWVVRPYFDAIDAEGQSLAPYRASLAVSFAAIPVAVVMAFLEPLLSRALDRSIAPRRSGAHP